jgi:hypothetical protein
VPGRQHNCLPSALVALQAAATLAARLASPEAEADGDVAEARAVLAALLAARVSGVMGRRLAVHCCDPSHLCTLMSQHQLHRTVSDNIT